MLFQFSGDLAYYISVAYEDKSKNDPGPSCVRVRIRIIGMIASNPGNDYLSGCYIINTDDWLAYPGLPANQPPVKVSSFN